MFIWLVFSGLSPLQSHRLEANTICSLFNYCSITVLLVTKGTRKFAPENMKQAVISSLRELPLLITILRQKFSANSASCCHPQPAVFRSSSADNSQKGGEGIFCVLGAQSLEKKQSDNGFRRNTHFFKKTNLQKLTKHWFMVSGFFPRFRVVAAAVVFLLIFSVYCSLVRVFRLFKSLENRV